MNLIFSTKSKIKQPSVLYDYYMSNQQDKSPEIVNESQTRIINDQRGLTLFNQPITNLSNPFNRSVANNMSTVLEIGNRKCSSCGH